METLGPDNENVPSMPCALSEQSMIDLENKGWQKDSMFNADDSIQRDEAYKRVEVMKAAGFFEPVLVRGQSDQDRSSSVYYIYQRKTKLNHFIQDSLGTKQ